MRLNAFEKLNALNCFIFFVYLQRFFAFSHYHWYQWKVLVLAQCWHFGRHKNIGSHDSRYYTMSVFSQPTSIRAERALLSALCPDVAFEHRRIALIFFILSKVLLLDIFYHANMANMLKFLNDLLIQIFFHISFNLFMLI